VLARVRERRRREDFMKKLPPQTFWLISKIEAGRMDVLTADLVGQRPALPVFSFADEAAMYLDLGPEQGRWRVRETAIGELVSVLLGPCAGVGRVLLDPVPDLDGRVLSELIGVEKGDFVEHLLGSVRRRARISRGRKIIGHARRSRPRVTVWPYRGEINAWREGPLSSGAG
jgi:hypothetical protein